MQHSMALCDFGAAVLLTDQILESPPIGVEIHRIPKLESAAAYSRFILSEIPKYVATSHVLVIQWDGFVVRPEAWDPAFMDFDYIGALWPQFSDGAVVGNGGFSLRSKRLLDACRTIGLAEHPEDIAICRTHRARLEEEFGICFASPAMAANFSYERFESRGTEFGFHGVFNLPNEAGHEGFWRTYQMLDDYSTLGPDFRKLLWSVFRHRQGFLRAISMLTDRLFRHASSR